MLGRRLVVCERCDLVLEDVESLIKVICIIGLVVYDSLYLLLLRVDLFVEQANYFILFGQLLFNSFQVYGWCPITIIMLLLSLLVSLVNEL